FELIISGVDFTESKPSPEIYLHTIEKLGLPAEACCCIEDSVPGITAGKRAGLTVFAKREDRFGFSQDAADAILDRVDDILDVAPRLFG
ncbi:MAG TPA: HAD-IA family hydrolase, partial [Candidatus Coprousia avicola]|nr:HAD-IA family hydrolase [Candidatus Coprousia avicola]